MKPLKFWQTQLPNGQVNNSGNQLVFLIGWGVLFLLIIFYAVARPIWGIKPDYVFMGMVGTYVNGQKIWHNAIAKDNVSETTPQVPDEPKEEPPKEQ